MNLKSVRLLLGAGCLAVLVVLRWHYRLDDGNFAFAFVAIAGMVIVARTVSEWRNKIGGGE
jgi:hypothetical protein